MPTLEPGSNIFIHPSAQGTPSVDVWKQTPYEMQTCGRREGRREGGREGAVLLHWVEVRRGNNSTLRMLEHYVGSWWLLEEKEQIQSETIYSEAAKCRNCGDGVVGWRKLNPERGLILP